MWFYVSWCMPIMLGSGRRYRLCNSAGKNRSEPQQASDTCRTDFLLDPFGERSHHTGQDSRLSDGDRGASNLLAVYPHRKMDVFSGRHSQNQYLVCLLHSDDPDPSDRRFSRPVSGKEETYRLPGTWRLLYLPAFFLIGLVFSNGFHQQVFSFPEGRYCRKCLFL